MEFFPSSRMPLVMESDPCLTGTTPRLRVLTLYIHTLIPKFRLGLFLALSMAKQYTGSWIARLIRQFLYLIGLLVRKIARSIAYLQFLRNPFYQGILTRKFWLHSVQQVVRSKFTSFLPIQKFSTMCSGSAVGAVIRFVFLF